MTTPKSPVPYTPDLPLSTRTVLGAARTNSILFTLVHATAGYEPAGSMARWTNESWGACYQLKDGTQGGQWFSTLQAASLKFKRAAVLGERI
jgi:hypothetical protein